MSRILNRRFRYSILLSSSISIKPPSKSHICFYSSRGPPQTLYRRRSLKPQFPSNPTRFNQLIGSLPPRFSPEDLCKILTLERNPNICLQIFDWASQQPRFRHDVSTYLITIKKLGSAKMYEEMEKVIDEALAFSSNTSEILYNTIIYFYTEARKLMKAVNVYKLMKKSKDPSCKPTIRTYNLLFTAFLSRGSNSYINHVYMDTIRSLFKQMVDEGIEPDIFALNSMIKGYVISLHVNDALRIYHQMGVVYRWLPNATSYNLLIHGLCAQSRSKNAKELYDEMMEKGFLPGDKAYNSFANCLALCGEIEEAVRILWEMGEKRRFADFITYKTVLHEICKQGRINDAMNLLREFHEKDLVDDRTYKKLYYILQDKLKDSDEQNISIKK